MLQLRTILAPIDFSDRSRATAEHAVHMANRFQSNLILVHVKEPIAYRYAEYTYAPGAEAEIAPHADADRSVEADGRLRLEAGLNRALLDELLKLQAVVERARRRLIDPVGRDEAAARRRGLEGGLRRGVRAREAEERKELEARRAVLRVESTLRDTRRETDEVIAFWRDFLEAIL